MKLAIEHHATRIDNKSNYLFGRREFAQNLNNIFLNIDGGFVLAIDANWGEGKTAFIHQLIYDLKKSDQLVPIYYDAFSNDFSSDTFLSIGATIVYEVEKRFKQLGKSLKTATQIEHLKSVTKNTAVELIKLGADLGLKSLTAGVIQSSHLEKIATSAISAATFGTLQLDIHEKFKSYENAKSNINLYIKALEGVCKNDEKVVFFIDELDRCRPNFAVEILEKIKHIFPAKNVIFVLSYNKNQLSKIISSVYGVDLDDSRKYLEKFVHIEANLPTIDDDNEKGSYEELFDSFMCEFDIVIDYKDNRLLELKKMFVSLCSHQSFRMNSREIERSFSYVSFCFASLPKSKGVELFEYFLPAAMIKVKSTRLFEQVKAGVFNSIPSDSNDKWLYEFFKKYYKESLREEAINIYYVDGFKRACDIVSMFKLPSDDG